MVVNTNWMYLGTNGCTICALAISMNLSGTDPCGAYTQNIIITAYRISGYGYRATLFSNPATSFTNVSLEPLEGYPVVTTENFPRTSSSNPLLESIKIANQTGVV